MKLTSVLLRQRIPFHFQKHWNQQSKRKLVDRGVVKYLAERGIPLYKPEDLLQKNKPIHTLIEEVPDYIPKSAVLDSTHPDWNSRVCYTYKDSNVLLEGLNQARVITKSVAVQEGLPEIYRLSNLPIGFDKRVKQVILNAHVFDAEQKKLPKIKDPTRPAWNFPRTYGITDARVNEIILTKLLQLVESMADINIVGQRNLIHDLHFSYPFVKDNNLIQLQLRSDMLLTSINPLNATSSNNTDGIPLPDLFPVDYINTLSKENIYKIRNIYPIKTTIAKSHPHTIFIHYNRTEVSNLYEEEVTESQILGRSLLKTFCVAASYAKQRFGDDVGVLPTPVTVQCIQTDGRLFDFGVLQLNTLDLTESSGVKNIWYNTSQMPLFSSCCYNLGKPVLAFYDNTVIKHLIAFYNSI